MVASLEEIRHSENNSKEKNKEVDRCVKITQLQVCVFNIAEKQINIGSFKMDLHCLIDCTFPSNNGQQTHNNHC